MSRKRGEAPTTKRLENPCPWCWERERSANGAFCHECGEKIDMNPFGYCAVGQCNTRAVTKIFSGDDDAKGIPVCEKHGSKYIIEKAKAAPKEPKKRGRKPAAARKPTNSYRRATTRPNTCDVCGDSSLGSICEVCKDWAFRLMVAA